MNLSTLISVLLFTVTLLHSINSQCLTDNDAFVDVDDSQTDNVFLLGANQFASRLLKTLHGQSPEENLFFSPYSVFSALFLAYLGTSGNTETQLQHVLGLQSSNKMSALRYNNLHTMWLHMRASGRKYDLNLANAIYFNKNETIRPCIESMFADIVQKISFEDPEKARSLINDWVSLQTSKKIDEFLPPDAVNPSTRMVLLNAAYFKGLWQSQFKKSQTSEKPFWLTPSSYVQVTMMAQKNKFWFYASRELQAYTLMMPYLSTDRSQPDISLFVVLPVFGQLNTTLQSMTPEILKDVRQKMDYITVDLEIPRFKVEQSFQLRDTLAHLGVVDLFVPGLADLSVFTDDNGISIGSAVHKAVIEVNEEGSEAAAATGLISFRTARIEEPTKFHCNSPFIYFIYDNLADNVMFSGIFNKPAAS